MSNTIQNIQLFEDEVKKMKEKTEAKLQEVFPCPIGYFICGDCNLQGSFMSCYVCRTPLGGLGNFTRNWPTEQIIRTYPEQSKSLVSRRKFRNSRSKKCRIRIMFQDTLSTIRK